ncbi:antitoxin [Microbacterium sp. CH12i]|uniref:hypothetical protein n=1 Tax=Microbacterium sp. CH12i TaxID=1479651 RepID=UPI000461C179|nr:hypothetical protein [Microbacterium sp. CH12i]KDA05685.1 antitoxin [Microbacterium sp. CH12i]
MRTTVTLDPDSEALVRRLMAEHGISFKRALNDAIRGGMSATASRSKRSTRVRHMGEPTFDLDRALSLSGNLEDEEVIRKMRMGK